MVIRYFVFIFLVLTTTVVGIEGSSEGHDVREGLSVESQTDSNTGINLGTTDDAAKIELSEAAVQSTHWHHRHQQPSQQQQQQQHQLLLLATLDGQLHALSRATGRVRWSWRGAPVIRAPRYDQSSRSQVTFLPDASDGSLYVLAGSSAAAAAAAGGASSGATDMLHKLPFTVPDLVAASPCRTADGLLYTGKKVDGWLAVHGDTGAVHEFNTEHTDLSASASAAPGESDDDLCPAQTAGFMFLGRTEYTVSMHDSRVGRKRWNITYSRYVAPEMPQSLRDQQTDVLVSTSSTGLVMSVDRDTGQVLWQTELESPLVGAFVPHYSNVYRIAHTVVAMKTLTNQLARRQLHSSRLVPTLYIGECKAGMYALPSLVDESTVHVITGQSNLPLLEGPGAIGSDNSESSQSSGSYFKLNSDSTGHLPFRRLLIGHHDVPRVSNVKLAPLHPEGANTSVESLTASSTLSSSSSSSTTAAAATTHGVGGGAEVGEGDCERDQSTSAPVAVSSKSSGHFRTGVNSYLPLSWIDATQPPCSPSSPSNAAAAATVVSTQRLPSDQFNTTSQLEFVWHQLVSLNGSYIASADWLRPLLLSVTSLTDTVTWPALVVTAGVTVVAYCLVQSTTSSAAAAAAPSHATASSCSAGAPTPLPVRSSSSGPSHSSSWSGSSAASSTAAASSSGSSDQSQLRRHVTAVAQQLDEGVVRVGAITFDTQQCLGKGCEGTFVFKGWFDGRDVAVKRLLPECFTFADREVDLLRESDQHPNVIRYFCMEQDHQFRYIALQLCVATMHDYVQGRYQGPPIERLDILRQAAAGLAHLHALNIVHRDVKPHNVLLSVCAGAAVAQISDFGLCKKLVAGRNSFSRRSGVAGTEGWIAPEMLDSDMRVTSAVDVFSMGCVIFYVLSGGQHPFGSSFHRQLNIINGAHRLDALKDQPVACSLVAQTVSRLARDRPAIDQLLAHPLFWSSDTALRFLQELSDRTEKLDMECELMKRLERRGWEVLYSKRASPAEAPPADTASAAATTCAAAAAAGAAAATATAATATTAIGAAAAAVAAGGAAAECGGGGGEAADMVYDWRLAIDAPLLADLGRFRSYRGSSVRDLLRAIRNKRNHYRSLEPAARQLLGESVGQFADYWLSRFPRLLIHCWTAGQLVRNETEFAGYYCGQFCWTLNPDLSIVAPWKRTPKKKRDTKDEQAAERAVARESGAGEMKPPGSSLTDALRATDGRTNSVDPRAVVGSDWCDVSKQVRRRLVEIVQEGGACVDDAAVLIGRDNRGFSALPSFDQLK